MRTSRQVVIVTLVAVMTFLLFAAIARAEYKCLATLYPKQAAKSGLGKLGETIILESGYKYRVLGECKSLERDMWLQFIDTTNPSNASSSILDNKCDFVVQLYLDSDDKIYMTNVFHDCGMLLESLKGYCEDHNITLEQFIHKAPPLRNGGTV